MGNWNIDIDLGLIAIIIALVLCSGEPDFIDAQVYKATGVQTWIEKCETENGEVKDVKINP